MTLPQPLTALLSPLFEALPLEQAMPELVPRSKTSGMATEIVTKVASDPLIKKNPSLEAGLWLYVDDLDRSHTISQNIPGSVGSLWHGIMHRREGDFSNSKYWFRQADRTSILDTAAASEFVDLVAARHQSNPSELVVRQRQEWAKLFEWCAQEATSGGDKA